MQQFAKVLPNDNGARKTFVQSGGLQKIQELQADEDSELQEYISTINACYPPEIVQYYSPNYSETLLKKLDEYEVFFIFFIFILVVLNGGILPLLSLLE